MQVIFHRHWLQTSLEADIPKPGGNCSPPNALARLREDGFGDGRALEKFQHDYPVLRVPGCTRRFRGDFDYRGRDLIYCDPPYLPSMRTSERRCRFEYQERDHIELLQLLKRSPCQVTLSGYPSAV